MTIGGHCAGIPRAAARCAITQLDPRSGQSRRLRGAQLIEQFLTQFYSDQAEWTPGATKPLSEIHQPGTTRVAGRARRLTPTQPCQLAFRAARVAGGVAVCRRSAQHKKALAETMCTATPGRRVQRLKLGGGDGRIRHAAETFRSRSGWPMRRCRIRCVDISRAVGTDVRGLAGGVSGTVCRTNPTIGAARSGRAAGEGRLERRLRSLEVAAWRCLPAATSHDSARQRPD